jgi:hypothetical protein
MLVRNTRSEKHELKMRKVQKNMASVPETNHSFSLIIHCRSPTHDKYERYFYNGFAQFGLCNPVKIITGNPASAKAPFLALHN